MNNIQEIINTFDDEMQVEVVDLKNGINLDISVHKEIFYPKSYNIFTIPHKDIYKLYSLCSKEIQSYIQEKDLVFERLNIFCYARLLKVKDFNAYSDMSPTINTSFYGIVNISDSNQYYHKDGLTKVLKPGEIKIHSGIEVIKFPSSTKDGDMIYLSIAPAEGLQAQMHSLWIPVL